MVVEHSVDDFMFICLPSTTINPNARVEEFDLKACKHSRLEAKGPPLVGEEVRKRVGT